MQQFLQTEPIQVILLSGTYHIYLYIIYIYRISYVCMYGWMYVCMCIIEGSLEVKLPTIWTDEKQSREEAERRDRLEERRVEEKE